jgi:RNA polymerase sigma-70 factor (ECF subfamily)
MSSALTAATGRRFPALALSYARTISSTETTSGGGATPSDEIALVARARGGDALALEQLLRANYDRAFAVCRRVLGSEQDALDATQEAMIAIARGIGRFDGRSRFGTWAYRVATNAALDELRRRQRRPRLDVSGDLETVTMDRQGSDTVGDATAIRLTIDDALDYLSEDHRIAVVLRDIEDLDYAEIAAILGVPIGTVRSRIARGRAAIVAAFGEQRGGAVTKSQRNDGAGASVKPPRQMR